MEPCRRSPVLELTPIPWIFVFGTKISLLSESDRQDLRHFPASTAFELLFQSVIFVFKLSSVLSLITQDGYRRLLGASGES